jgi:hypothetical protein
MSRPARHLDTDKKTLDEFLGSGIQQVRVLLRALAIRHLGDGCSATEAAVMVRLTPMAARALAVRYRQGALQRALYDKAHPGKKQLLDTPTRHRLTRPPLCA